MKQELFTLPFSNIQIASVTLIEGAWIFAAARLVRLLALASGDISTQSEQSDEQSRDSVITAPEVDFGHGVSARSSASVGGYLARCLPQWPTDKHDERSRGVEAVKTERVVEDFVHEAGSRACLQPESSRNQIEVL
jgi:hypothetical protein